MSAPEMEATPAFLEGLGGLVLETIIGKAGARPAAALSCASTALRLAASDDDLWRRFCSDDLGLDAAADPDGNLLPSFKETYKTWCESFGMYPLPVVRRVNKLWSSMKGWLAANFPEALNTLNKGASEAEIKFAEGALGLKLPMPTKVLYRFCNGQQSYTDEEPMNMHLAHLGIIGGYEFYDHFVNVHLSPLEKVIDESKHLASKVRFLRRSKRIVVAGASRALKLFFLDCANGQLYVNSKTLKSEEEMIPCVPNSLIKLNVDAPNVLPQDALLLWLEEHLRRLQSGFIKIRMTGEFRSINLYPEAHPLCSSAVTNGVKVRASALFVPEESDRRGGEERYYYTYSIRMSLLPEGCMLDGTYYSSCQLFSRHWIIRSGERVVSSVNAEAVIGKYPFLTPGMEEFVYQSCTPLPDAPGSVEGSFTFFPGRLSKPEGRQFDVVVAPFPLEKPEYVF